MWGTFCTHRGKFESPVSTVSENPAGCIHAGESANFARPYPNDASRHTEEADCHSGPSPSRGFFRDDAATAQNGQEIAEPSANMDSSNTPGAIRSSDFCEIDRGFDSGPCDCCGFQWVHFQERMTRERLYSPPRMNQKICKACYEKARRNEAASIRTLPQMIDPVALVRLTTDLGRCQVCDTFKATWHDPVTRTAICDSCRFRTSQGS